MKCKITVECADITNYSCDVLVLKFAGVFHGADRQIANIIRPNQTGTLHSRPGGFKLVSSENKIAAESVLFVGVASLYNFDYGRIRRFASRSLEILAKKKLKISHIAMTMHGTGYGLDEKEAFLSQIGGLMDAFNAKTVPDRIRRITIVEREKERAKRLSSILKKHLSSAYFESQELVSQNVNSEVLRSAGVNSNSKPHIFVAMPFGKEMADTYRFGIQNPINAAGFLCERVDMEMYTGDIMMRVKSRIESANLVVADLTGSNPNVYLEVGYAWGKDRPTLLIAKKDEELKFDVRGQRCLIYENITDLESKLSLDLEKFKKQEL